MQGSLDHPPITLAGGWPGRIVVIALFGFPPLAMGAVLVNALRDLPDAGAAKAAILYALLAVLSLAGAGFGVRQLLHPPTLTIGPDGIAYRTVARTRSWTWSEVRQPRLGHLCVELNSAQPTLANTIPGGWSIRNSQLLDLILSARLRWTGVPDDRAPPGEREVNVAVVTLLAALAAPALCLVLIGAYHRAHPAPVRRFAAPAYVLPAGCAWMAERSGVTAACDQPSTQIAAAPDFDLGAASKGNHWIRFGDDAADIACGWPWKGGCNIQGYAANRFFQPTPEMIATLRAKRSTYRGSPVELAPGLYGYPDMFP